MKRSVQLPCARVRRAVDAADVRRRQPLIAALVADGVLLTLVVHVWRQPEAADAGEAQRRGRRRAALVGSGRRGLVSSGKDGGGLGLARTARIAKGHKHLDDDGAAAGANFKQVLHEPSINPARQSGFAINPFLLARVLVERRALLALDAKQPADRQPGAKP